MADSPARGAVSGGLYRGGHPKRRQWALRAQTAHTSGDVSAGSTIQALPRGDAGARLSDIGELMANIFAHLEHDRPTLRAALFVSKSWSVIVEPFYWAHPPENFIFTLLTKETPAKARLCSKHVRSVVLSRHVTKVFEESIDAKEVVFGRVEELILSNHTSYHHLGFLLSDSLRVVKIAQGRPREHLSMLLSMLSQHCKKLVEFSIEAGIPEIEDYHLEYIKSHTRCFSVEFGYETYLSDEMLLHLASRSDLRRVIMPCAWCFPPLQQILGTFPRVFANVVSLCIPTDPRLMSIVAQKASNVENLTLWHGIAMMGASSANPTIAYVGAFPKLRRLALMGDEDFDLELDSLTAMRDVRGLEHLVLGDRLSVPVVLPFDSPIDCLRFFSRWHNLKSFAGNLDFSSEHSQDLVCAIRHGCLGLKTCWYLGCGDQQFGDVSYFEQSTYMVEGMSLQVNNIRIPGPMNMHAHVEAGPAWIQR